MNYLSNKNIILGVSGGIAAYKSADLTRRLIEVGATVQVVMTESACEFVTPMTFQALSGREVRIQLFDAQGEAGMSHIELARWADLILIAPATANTISRIAQGAASNLLTTLCLATKAPIAIAPAMNTVMWEQDSTQKNIQLLAQRGLLILGPGVGEQACKEVGAGRMLEPLNIRQHIIKYFQPQQTLRGKKVLITAGPTQEAIDPVRYISNHSSGKMGYAIAQACKDAGASVILVSGPTNLKPPSDIYLIDVLSADQMLDSVHSEVKGCDIFIAVAAVADYKVKSQSNQKIKKTDANQDLEIKLTKNPDILASVATLTNDRPFCVGFAAETQDLSTYAQDKLKRKNLDIIAANHVSTDENNVFNSDNNKLEIFLKNGEKISLSLANKQVIAEQLINIIAKQL